MNFVDLKKLKIDCRFKDGGKFPSHTEPHVQPELAQRNGIRWLPHSCLIDGVLSQVSETPHSFRNKIIFGHFSSSWKKTDKQKPANYWWLKCCEQIWFVNKFVKGVNLNISVRWTAGRCLTWWTRRIIFEMQQNVEQVFVCLWGSLLVCRWRLSYGRWGGGCRNPNLAPILFIFFKTSVVCCRNIRKI